MDEMMSETFVFAVGLTAVGSAAIYMADIS